MIQYIDGDLVHGDRLAEARDGGLTDIESATLQRHGARTYFDSIDNSANGVFGDQTDATAAKGERLFEAATEQLVQLADWLSEQEFEALMPEEHV